MTSRSKVVLCWSSGKDSAWALHVLRQQSADVVGLLTTVNEAFGRVAMHAVRAELLRAQASAVRLPLLEVPLPHPCSNALYDARMASAVADLRDQGVSAVAFGDLFLQDVREYREARMRETGLTPIFPLWGCDTHMLAREMLASGLAARLTCIDPHHLDPSFAGRDFDASLLADLPPTCDPCGERGEFHTFAYDGPMFSHRLKIASGTTVERGGFLFTDVSLADDPPSYPSSACPPG